MKSERLHHTGIALRHSRRCASRSGEECSCTPTYQAQAWSARDSKPLRKTFKTLKEAKNWRQEAQVALRKRQLNAPSRVLLREAAEEWLKGAKKGVIRTISGDPYKPASLRAYEWVLKSKILPELGDRRLSAITRNQVQDLIDVMVAEGSAASSVRNTFMPLRAIYRRVAMREEVAFNPMLTLCYPAVRSKRERVAHGQEAERLIGAAPEGDRALWATALYAGLRRGELQALRWQNIDLIEGVIRVQNSWDRVAGFIKPKSRPGTRKVPIPKILRTYLAEHRLRSGRAEGFVFTNRSGKPFIPKTVMRRARKAWSQAGLEPIVLHECRHTYAAFMIAAGLNVKALSTYLGHSTIAVTLDLYGHLLPENEKEAAGVLDRYLQREIAA